MGGFDYYPKPNGHVAAISAAEGGSGEASGAAAGKMMTKKKKKKKGLFSWGETEEEKAEADKAATVLQSQFRGIKSREEVIKKLDQQDAQGVRQKKGFLLPRPAC